MDIPQELVLRERTSHVDNTETLGKPVETELPASATSQLKNEEGEKHDVVHLSNVEQQQRIFEHNHSYYTDDLSLLRETSPSPTDYFRLLVIQPAGFDDPLACWLITECLSEEVEYEALSYTWGQGGRVHEISINGREGFWITQNAFSALRRIRQRGEARTIWIDAVCINQHHPLERSQQVGNMHRIYKWASTVLCWFGPCDATLPGEEEAEDCALHERTGKKEVDCQGSSMSGDDGWDRWWHRLWTVQEYCLAQEVRILIGPHTYEYWELHRIAEVHKDDKTHILGRALKSLDNRQSISIHLTSLMNETLRKLGKLNPFNLRRMLLMTKHCVCNDPRDRIYALVALHDGNMPFEVDYTLTVHQVYALATIWMMKQAGNVEMLLDQNWPRMESPAGRSWCPDFSYTGKEQFGGRGLSLPVRQLGMEASHESEMESVRLDGGNLVLSGVRFDLIRIKATGFDTQSNFTILAKDLDQASSIDGPLVEKLRSCKRYIRRNCANAVQRYKSEDGLSGALAATISTSGADAAVSKKEIRHSQLKSATVMGIALADRCLFVTQRGYIGLASNDGVCLTDEIVIVRGLSMPLVLRRDDGEAGYRIVGQAYVHDVADETLRWEDIVLLGG